MKRSFRWIIAALASLGALASCESVPEAADAAGTVNAVQKELRAAAGNYPQEQAILALRKGDLEQEIARCARDRGGAAEQTTCLLVSAVAWDLLGQYSETDVAEAVQAMSDISGRARPVCEQNGHIRKVASDCELIGLYSSALGARLSARQIATALNTPAPSVRQLTVHYQALEDQVSRDWPSMSAGGAEPDVALQLRRSALCTAVRAYTDLQPLAGSEGGADLMSSARGAISAGAGALNLALCVPGEAGCNPEVCSADAASLACERAREAAALLICRP